MKRLTQILLLTSAALALTATSAAQKAGTPKAPTAGTSTAVSLKMPPYKKVRLKNGATLLLMERHTVPLIGFQVLIRAGSAGDPQLIQFGQREGSTYYYSAIGQERMAAILTPPDALSMMLMLGPLTLLYEVSIWCAWVATRRRARRAAVPRQAGHRRAAGQQLESDAQALADRDFLTAVLTQFRLDLDHGVEERLFVKSLW